MEKGKGVWAFGFWSLAFDFELGVFSWLELVLLKVIGNLPGNVQTFRFKLAFGLWPLISSLVFSLG